MSGFEKTDLNQVRRVPDRGKYDKETVYAIVDDALICNVGIVQDGRPIIIPTIHARQDDTILLHGATTSRLMRYLASGQELCITVTHLDGLVLARAVFHHSMNYRSAVLFGTGKLIDDPEEKLAAMKTFTDKLIPYRWDDARVPNQNEIKATHIVAVTIDSASAKVREGNPGDDDEDYDLDVWAGVLPLRPVFGELLPDDRLKEGIPIPSYLTEYAKTKK